MTIPPALAHDLQAGRVIPFVGSGAPMGQRVGRWELQHTRGQTRTHVAGGHLPAVAFGAIRPGGRGRKRLGMVRGRGGHRPWRWPCCAWRLLGRRFPERARRHPRLVATLQPRQLWWFSCVVFLLFRTRVIRCLPLFSYPLVHLLLIPLYLFRRAAAHKILGARGFEVLAGKWGQGHVRISRIHLSYP